MSYVRPIQDLTGGSLQNLAATLLGIEKSNIANQQAAKDEEYRRQQANIARDEFAKKYALLEAQDKRAAQAAEDTRKKSQAEMYAAGLRADTSPSKVLSKKGTTTVIPAREGLVTDPMYKTSDLIGTKADELIKLNERIEGKVPTSEADRFSGDTLRSRLQVPDQPMVQGKPIEAPYVDPTYKYAGNSTKMNAYMNRYNGKPMNVKDANSLVATKDEMKKTVEDYKKNLLSRRDSLIKEIDTLTAGVVDDYKDGARDRSEIKTKDEYTFKAPTYESIYRGMEKQAKKEGREITNELKYAMRQRADTLFKDAREQADKERRFQLDEKKTNAYAKSVTNAVYGKKSSKTKDKVSDFAEKLYKALPSDPDAVTKYIQANSSKLAAGTPEALDALVAKISAEVANESSWDITNWAPTWAGGGTNERDVLFK